MKDDKKYITIYESIKNDILTGIYPYMSKLPSKRVTADRFGTSLVTVEHAMELLMEEDYIRTKERSGYYISYEEGKMWGVGGKSVKRPGGDMRRADGGLYSQRAQERPAQPEESGFSFPLYARTVRKILTDYGESVFERSPAFGHGILREAVSQYLLKSRHINADEDQIIIGSGAEYLYGLIVRAFGREIIYGLENPSYEKIGYVYRSEGVRCRLLNLGNDGIESNALWKSDVNVLHITPYRSYPSGVTATASKKHEYLKWCNEKNAIIIEDDFESEFSPSRRPEETVFYLNHGKNVIYVNTFTKTIGSFIRTAYMVLPENLVPLFNERMSYCACTVPTPEQYVISELIDSGEFERHINRVRRKKRELIR